MDETEQALQVIENDKELMADPQVKAKVLRIRQKMAADAKGMAAKTQGVLSEMDQHPVREFAFQEAPSILGGLGVAAGERLGGHMGAALTGGTMAALGASARQVYREQLGQDKIGIGPQSEVGKFAELGVNGAATALSVPATKYATGALGWAGKKVFRNSPLAMKIMSYLSGESPVNQAAAMNPELANLSGPAGRRILANAEPLPRGGGPQAAVRAGGVERANLAEAEAAAQDAARSAPLLPGLRKRHMGARMDARKANIDLVDSMGGDPSPRQFQEPWNYPQFATSQPVMAESVRVGHAGKTASMFEGSLQKATTPLENAYAKGVATPAAARQAAVDASTLDAALPRANKVATRAAAFLADRVQPGMGSAVRAAGDVPDVSARAANKFAYGLAGNRMEAGQSVPPQIAQALADPAGYKQVANLIRSTTAFAAPSQLTDEDHTRLINLYNQLNQEKPK